MSSDELKEIVRETVRETLEHHHVCQFSNVDPKELQDAWPVLRGIASTTQQTQKIATTVIITAMITFFIGLVGRGVYQWLAEAVKKSPPP